MNPSPDLCNRALLKATYEQSTISNDFQWMADLDQTDAGWLNNPFILASYAGHWSEAARLAGKLFNKFPKILTEKVCEITPLTDDHEAWPGLAAVFSQKQNSDLDAFRSELILLLAKKPELAAGMDRACKVIREGGDYGEVFNSWRQV